jgi:transposase
MKIPQLKQRVQVIKGVSYVYDDDPYWDSVKQQTRHRRHYIGKLDEQGQFVPNARYLASQQLRTLQQTLPKKRGRKAPPSQRSFYGACWLLKKLSQHLGLTEDLEAAFGEEALHLLALAFYLVMEKDSPMYRFTHWQKTHWLPTSQELSSQRISELFAQISPSACQCFFRKQQTRRLETEHLAYDTTSISSYSQLMKHVKYGYNKDGEALPQINLALVFGQSSMLPVYYRKLPGNMTDVKTVQKLLLDLDQLGFHKIKLVMDRGFYSHANLQALFDKHVKFLLAAKTQVRWIQQCIKAAKPHLQHFSAYDPTQQMYCTSTTETWRAEATGEGGKEGISRRIYVHVYYSGTRAEEEKQDFLQRLHQVMELIEEEVTLEESQEILKERYLVATQTPKRGWKIKEKQEAIEAHLSTLGYMVLLSNSVKDPRQALSLYRQKDVVEKAFGNLKNRLNMKRAYVSSNESFDGKLFVNFIGLILISAIHKVMKTHDLYGRYSMRELLDELDLIERFDEPGRSAHLSEMTKKQETLLTYFGLDPKTML